MTDIVERLRAAAKSIRFFKAASMEAADLDEAADEIERLRAALKVRPLKWLWNGKSPDHLMARSVIGLFSANKTANKRNDKYMVTYIDPEKRSHTIGYIDGIEAAKATAQANYERRIRAALTQEGK